VIRRQAAALVLLVAALLLWPPGALGQRSGVNVPGDFDYYVLALSWSPSYCALEGTPADRLQCGGGRTYAFVVHGLWPQYERGWPEFCPAMPAQVPEQQVRRMLDLMPSESLVRHQWTKHGTCSGLSPEGYFDATRRARARVDVPAAFARLSEHVSVSPAGVAGAFMQANPGLPADGIAVTCDRNHLREVRVCLDRFSLDFRSCPPVAERNCRMDSVRMPAARGG
jgi:ribonuclease T2